MKELGDLDQSKKPGFFKRHIQGLGDHKVENYLTHIWANNKKYNGIGSLPPPRQPRNANSPILLGKVMKLKN